ncbi:MAG: hypothetical protein E3J23_08750 [Candidatus Stahlbacteria bacterium]|nr:MAG: hypothetical protein E3J23_08750 [Candidatus Stahlbacteria bacterium]
MSITDLTELAGRRSDPISKRLTKGLKPWGNTVAEGDEPGTFGIDKFGRNPTASAIGDVIQDEDGPIVIETVATAVELISSDAQDNPSGTGAKAILIQGVDINWNPIEEILATNGVTVSSSTTQEFLYVYRAKIKNSGAQRTAGHITIKKTGAGATMAMIYQGYGQTQKAVMPVFAGCKMYIDILRFEGSKTGSLVGEIMLMEYQLNEGIRVIHSLVFKDSDQKIIEWPEVPKVFQEKTLVWIEIRDAIASNVMTASFDGVMERYEDSTP